MACTTYAQARVVQAQVRGLRSATEGLEQSLREKQPSLGKLWLPKHSTW